MLLIKVFFFLLAVYVILLLFKWNQKRKRIVDLIARLPGPTRSGSFEIAALVYEWQEIARHYKLDSYVIVYGMLLGFVRQFINQGLTHVWLGPEPGVILFAPEMIEPVLNSTQIINKASLYHVFEPWIGEGLVTSKRGKWNFRRKVLTPAFHFRILNDFLPMINNEADKLVHKLNRDKYLDAKRVNIVPIIALCTLETICQTAMGTSLGYKMDNTEEAPYVKALHEVGETALARVSRPWLWPDFIYYRTEFGKRFTKARDLTHAFTTSVIKEKKKEWEQILLKSGSRDNDKKITFEETLQLKYAQKQNKRMAFLDLLLYQHLIEKTMSIDDVREEVDTFMFAGHDTTAMNICWTLYMLGLDKDIQDKVRDEIDYVLISEDTVTSIECDKNMNETILAKKLLLGNINTKHLRELRYLDQVIKETLRMWPSIPFIGRELSEDIRVGSNGEHLLPKGSSCMIFIHALHHNPNYYTKPEVFDPDRFSPEEIAKRHPFAYIPFSAGPRNCIGQKFAGMEVKLILAKLIQNFYFESCEPLDKLFTVGELVLRPSSGLYVRITPRFNSLS